LPPKPILKTKTSTQKFGTKNSGGVRPLRRRATESNYPPGSFEREDESDDGWFYASPRLVVHIDEGAIAAVSQLFKDLIPADSAVLDLMSSWRSHWPQGHAKSGLVGLGLNAEEMKDNPDLDDYVVHNVNNDPVLPFADEIFDATVITVSPQYLTRPVETFQQVNRVLKPGGIVIVTFSNRMFPTKAVRIWRTSSDQGHMDLVKSYMENAGNFVDIQAGFVNAEQSPPADPIFAVVSRKAPSQPADV
jgi:SAM-dependent methyltransferase